MLIQPAPNGARGVNTTLRFNAPRAQAIKNAGYQFIIRYLEALTIAERDCILGAGLGLLAVGYSRRPGWLPTADLGAQDGAHHVEHATAAGLMRGMTLYCDLEGPGAATTGASCIGYVNTWARIVQSAGYIAGAYLGYGIPLSSSQLYHSLAVTQYWSGGGHPVDVRGYSMVQDNRSITVAGLLVDVDTISTDGRGDTPVFLIGDS